MATKEPKPQRRVYLLQASAIPLNRSEQERVVNIDFYVKAFSESEAGARAQDAFREHGWRFVEYVSLPAVLKDEHLRKDVRFRAGYEKALAFDEALVVNEDS